MAAFSSSLRFAGEEGMDALKNRQWRISVEAKSKGVDFKIQASNILHGFRVSLLLRVHSFFLEVKPSNGVVIRREARRSRFSSFLSGVFQRKSMCAEKKGLVREKGIKVGKPGCGRHFALQDPMATIIGSLSLLSHSGCQKDHEGITIHGLTFIFYLIMLLKRKYSHFPWALLTGIMLAVAVSCSYINYIGLATTTTWKTWANVSSLVCCFFLFQVLASRVLRPMGTKAMSWVLVLACIPFVLQYKTSIAIFPQGLKAVVEGASVWVPKLLLTCQVFSHILGQPGDPRAVGVYLSSAYFWAKEGIHRYH